MILPKRSADGIWFYEIKQTGDFGIDLFVNSHESFWGVNQSGCIIAATLLLENKTKSIFIDNLDLDKNAFVSFPIRAKNYYVRFECVLLTVDTNFMFWMG